VSGENTALRRQAEAAALDGSAMTIRRLEDGTLAVRIAGAAEAEGVTVRRAFPLEVTDGYIGFFDADGEELGLLEELQHLPDDSRAALEEQLAHVYFLPAITEVIDIGEEFGVVHADVQTTSGPRQIEIRGIRSNIRLLSRNRALIEDTEGNRYELRDFHRLPGFTREVLGL
jgi:hypothetical protein